MIVLPTAYLAPISWYKALLSGGEVQIEVMESFPKQTYRNRCIIAGPNGVQTLSVPVVKCEHKQLTRDVKICYQTKWQHQHRQAIVSAYRNTPFFDYYQDFFWPLYEKEYTYLLDLNTDCYEVVEKLITNMGTLNIPISPTKEYQGKSIEHYFEGHCKSYYQIFADRQGFKDNLSIVDLLFNIGHEALLYIQ